MRTLRAYAIINVMAHHARNQKTSLFREFGIPAAALVLFFLFQARGTTSELGLTFFIIAVSSVLFFWNRRIHEIYLFGVGTVAGFFLEVVFRLLGYQQVWQEASLFGVPIWLPFAWGMGFVLITRIGIFMRGISFSD